MALMKLSTGAQKADMFNEFFSNCFNRHSVSLEDWSESDFKLPDDPSNELLCDEDTVCELPASLDISKLSGPDVISAKMLKHTAVSTAPSITLLFNLSIKSGRVPRAWKKKMIICCTFIPKSGQSHLITTDQIS